jgi:putative heme iron utilization protein
MIAKKKADPIDQVRPPANPRKSATRVIRAGDANHPGYYTAAMNPERTNLVRQLLRNQSVAALGTLHDGEPFVSMVPFAMPPGGTDFFIHVSGLAFHTGDMLAHPRVSLMIMAPQAESAQSRARITLQGDATPLERGSGDYALAKLSYLGRFADAAPIFELGDFTLFRIAPRTLRVVGGFAQAFSSDAEDFAAAMREA